MTTTFRAAAARRVLAFGCAAAAALGLTACGGSHHNKHENATPVAQTTSATPSPTPTPSPKPPTVNPLTGLAPIPKGPVIAVKIDDTAPGRPQHGINKADVVYIEEAEGGLSRLVAVYASHKPVVGYVRSTRPSDPDLLLQYGKITEAASGGGHDALPLLDRSGIKGWINDRGAPYYSRVSRSESDYINLVLNLAKVTKAVRTAGVRSIGWTWSAALPPLPRTGKGTRVRTLVGGTSVEFRYNARTNLYTRYIDGVRQVDSTGKPVTTANVIVQVCRIVPHPQDTDVNGNPSQWTYTTGKGKVVVFRDGKAITGTWSRPRLNAGTSLLAADGRPIPLHPGGAWVALVRASAPIRG